ncbi:MAG: Rrf2 family transcriptional regulator, partial [Coriobacteriales bacterium]
TIAIHLLAATEYFGESHKTTSDFLASSIGCNPVIVRRVMSQLRQAGIISVRRGAGGVTLTRPLSDITFRDVLLAVEDAGEESMFHFHEHPNPACPVGGNIHEALDGQLAEIQRDFEADLASRTVQGVYDAILQAQRGA